jgi:hypothetical protein
VRRVRILWRTASSDAWAIKLVASPDGSEPSRRGTVQTPYSKSLLILDVIDHGIGESDSHGANYAIAAEFIRHELAAAVLPKPDSTDRPCGGGLGC